MTVAIARVSPPAPSADELDALVARAVAGDQLAFAALYRMHAGGVHALLTRLVGPRAEREDLLQDVFVRFHRALPRFRGDAALATFLHRIVVRVALDHLRARRRRPEAGAPLDEEVADTSASPEQRLAQRAEIERALGFLDGLGPEQRIAFVLREVLELSYPEIAQLMGTFATTARMRVTAATRALARLDTKGTAR
ncbi:MAG: sigma-70 family RNA polymerase sigma factor [Deltaproteobacteria bacterium]|nr:sigma-70 family RNA polymerase sigma factor [Kofleriaceae bacterium]